MKKLSILTVALVAMSFASCKKDYTCTCTYAGSTYGNKMVIKDVSKKQAQSQCVSGTTTSSAAGSTGYVQTCTLAK